MALRTSSSAVGGSATSPLRTPRERDWPRPMMLSVPAALTSPTAAQTFEVPISRPTMSEAGSNIFTLGVLQVVVFGTGGRHGGEIGQDGRDVAGNGKVQRHQRLA